MKTIERHNAFTIVELLVVIAIIGILLALLLPAVQATRESARRFQCMNNLKQLGLGVLQHVDVHQQYPTGGWGWYWIGDPDRGFKKRQPGGWFYNILPYIEENKLSLLPSDSDQYNVSEKQKVGANTLAKTPVPLINCPSRRPCTTFAKPDGGTFVAFNSADNTPEDNVAARGDYAANSGSQYYDEFFAGPTSLTEGDNPSFAWHDTRQCTGISFERSDIRPEQIRDGTTHTLMLGEKYLNHIHYATGLENYDNENAFTGFNNDNFRSTYFPPLRDQAGMSDEFAFGSNHVSTCNFVFCDGSVKSINYSIEQKIFFCLGNRSDGQTITDDEF
jgi:prepilin-type N-terminal cleavage/methylation domain-containing protein/prepilin-type processing-associated H-X9-DG protein